MLAFLNMKMNKFQIITLSNISYFNFLSLQKCYLQFKHLRLNRTAQDTLAFFRRRHKYVSSKRKRWSKLWLKKCEARHETSIIQFGITTVTHASPVSPSVLPPSFICFLLYKPPFHLFYVLENIHVNGIFVNFLRSLALSKFIPVALYDGTLQSVTRCI